MKYILRPAKLEDIKELYLLERNCFKESIILPRSFLYFITKAHAKVLLICFEKVICGYILILFRKNSNNARIYSIAVLPKYRGMGFGKVLFSAAEKLARKQKCNGITLEVRKTNYKAIKLYKQLAFTELKRIHHYYEDNMSAIKMMKFLT